MSLETDIALIEFDTPFIFDGKNIHEVSGFAPNVYIEEENLEPYIDSDGWEFVTGHSGQHGYDGPLMHDSEFVSTGMMKAMHKKYGATATYVFTVVMTETEDDAVDFAGWTVLVKR